jgi:hypothetical protein
VPRSSTVEGALRILESACQLETNRLYLIATGRLLGVVNLAEMHIDVPSRPATDLDALDNTALAESCVRILGLCLSEQPRTSGMPVITGPFWSLLLLYWVFFDI